MKRPNDIGGQPGGPVDPNAHPTGDWQKRLTALVTALGPTNKNIYCIDEFRRTREDIPEDFYNTLSYFELWAQGFSNLLIEKGVLTRDEIDQRMQSIRARGDP